MGECFMQGDAEKRLGIPVQALNCRDKIQHAFSQIGFIEFLVSPLYFAIVKVLPPTEPLAEQMVSNVKTWHKQWLSEAAPQPGDGEKKVVAERITKLEERYKQLFV